MADPNVKIIFTANSAQAEAAMARIEKRLRKIEALTKRGGKGPAAGIASGFNAAATAVGRFALSLAGLGSPLQAAFTVINQVRIAVEGLRAAQEDSARTNIDYEQALNGAFYNLGRRDPDIPNIIKLDEVITNLSKETGVDKTRAAVALGGALTARGDLPSTTALEATKVGLRTFRAFKAEDISHIVGSILDLMRTDPRITPEGAIGFLDEFSTRHRLKDVGKFAKNVMGPAVASYLGNRGKARFSTIGSLSSAISQGMVDTRGRMSSQAAVFLDRRLRETFLAIPPEDLPPGYEDSLLGRIRAVQQNPKLRAKLGKQIETSLLVPDEEGFTLSGRASVKSRDSLESILSGIGRVAENFNFNLKNIPEPTSKRAIASGKELREGFEQSPAFLVAQAERLLKTATTSEQLRRIEQSLGGVIRKGLRGLQASQGDIEQLLDLGELKFDLLSDIGNKENFRSAIKILENRARSLRTPGSFPGFVDLLQFALGDSKPFHDALKKAPSQEDLAQARAIERVAEQFEKLLEIQQEIKLLQQQNVDQNQPRINRNHHLVPDGVR